jgi:DNA-binding NarL/FixJ family response regulator
LGIHGFAHKDTDITAFTALLDKVLCGERSWERASVSSQGHRKDPTPPSFCLTVRDGEILNVLALGHTNWEIGSSLGVTEKTVRHYLTRIYATLGVRNRTEAALYAISELKWRKVPAELSAPSQPK